MHKNSNSCSLLLKVVSVYIFALASLGASAANFCWKTQSNGEWPPSPIYLSSSPSEVCSQWSMSYAPHVLSTSVEANALDKSPFGGSGYCYAMLDNAAGTSTSYGCACAPPKVTRDGIFFPDCSTKRIGFFNGVSNTRDEAIASRNRLKKEFGETYKNRPLEYELFYNQTQSFLEDFAEVFAQRNKELGGVLGDRWEIYWEMLAGRQNQLDSLTAGLLAGLRNQFGNAGNALVQLLDSIAANILNQLMGSFTKLLTLMSSPPTAADTAAHVAKIVKFINQGQDTSGMVLVAHSQGNLFVNAAYQGFITSPEVSMFNYKKVKVVHVAPASPTLTDSYYILADIDFVINSLRLTGVNGVPTANISLPLSNSDKLGHSFEGTYMDKARGAYAEVINLITTQLGKLKSY